MILLLPHLTLVDHGMERAAKRFEPAFFETWRRLPTDPKLVINNYLKDRPGRVYLCYKMDVGDPPEEPFGRGYWCADRTIFTFLGAFIIHAGFINGHARDDEGIVGVIGHELAHFFHGATGNWTADTTQEEINARSTTRVWGFPEPGIDKTIWKPGIEAWRRRHALDKGHLTEYMQVTG